MATVTFQQGVNYSGTIDTTIRQANPDAAPGSGTTLQVDGDSGAQVQTLLAFDGLFGTGAGQIPIGATITSATLTLKTTDATGSGVSVSRMLIDWSEQSSWNALGNGVQLDGIEAASTADRVIGKFALGLKTFDVTGSLQAWLAGATTPAEANAANNGWVFTALGTNLWAFKSSEAAAAPVLTVTYTTGGTTDPPDGDVLDVRIYKASTFGPAPGSTDPTDVAYDPSTGKFFVSDSEVDESPFFANTNLFMLDGDADPLQSYSLRGFTSEPTGLALWVDPDTGVKRLFICSDDQKRIFVVDPADPTVVLRSFSTTAFNVGDPEDLSINPNNGNLFVLSENDKSIYEVTQNGVFVSKVTLPSPFDSVAEGLVYDAQNDRFYVCGGFSSKIFIVSRTGALIDTIDVLANYPNEGGYRVFPKGLELAPSSDGSGNLSLWVTDYGKDQVADGRLFEIMLERPAQQAAAAVATTSAAAFDSFENSLNTLEAQFRPTAFDETPFAPTSLHSLDAWSWHEIPHSPFDSLL